MTKVVRFERRILEAAEIIKTAGFAPCERDVYGLAATGLMSRRRKDI
jgi:hypothetical protein